MFANDAFHILTSGFEISLSHLHEYFQNDFIFMMFQTGLCRDNLQYAILFIFAAAIYFLRSFFLEEIAKNNLQK